MQLVQLIRFWAYPHWTGTQATPLSDCSKTIFTSNQQTSYESSTGVKVETKITTHSCPKTPESDLPHTSQDADLAHLVKWLMELRWGKSSVVNWTRRLSKEKRDWGQSCSLKWKRHGNGQNAWPRVEVMWKQLEDKTCVVRLVSSNIDTSCTYV